MLGPYQNWLAGILEHPVLGPLWMAGWSASLLLSVGGLAVATAGFWVFRVSNSEQVERGLFLAEFAPDPSAWGIWPKFVRLLHPDRQGQFRWAAEQLWQPTASGVLLTVAIAGVVFLLGSCGTFLGSLWPHGWEAPDIAWLPGSLLGLYGFILIFAVGFGREDPDLAGTQVATVVLREGYVFVLIAYWFCLAGLQVAPLPHCWRAGLTFSWLALCEMTFWSVFRTVRLFARPEYGEARADAITRLLLRRAAVEHRRWTFLDDRLDDQLRALSGDDLLVTADVHAAVEDCTLQTRLRPTREGVPVSFSPKALRRAVRDLRTRIRTLVLADPDERPRCIMQFRFAFGQELRRPSACIAVAGMEAETTQASHVAWEVAAQEFARTLSSTVLGFSPGPTARSEAETMLSRAATSACNAAQTGNRRAGEAALDRLVGLLRQETLAQAETPTTQPREAARPYLLFRDRRRDYFRDVIEAFIGSTDRYLRHLGCYLPFRLCCLHYDFREFERAAGTLREHGELVFWLASRLEGEPRRSCTSDLHHFLYNHANMSIGLTFERLSMKDTPEMWGAYTSVLCLLNRWMKTSLDSGDTETLARLVDSLLEDNTGLWNPFWVEPFPERPEVSELSRERQAVLFGFSAYVLKRYREADEKHPQYAILFRVLRDILLPELRALSVEEATTHFVRCRGGGRDAAYEWNWWDIPVEPGFRVRTSDPSEMFRALWLLVVTSRVARCPGEEHRLPNDEGLRIEIQEGGSLREAVVSAQHDGDDGIAQFVEEDVADSLQRVLELLAEETQRRTQEAQAAILEARLARTCAEEVRAGLEAKFRDAPSRGLLLSAVQTRSGITVEDAHAEEPYRFVHLCAQKKEFFADVRPDAGLAKALGSRYGDEYGRSLDVKLFSACLATAARWEVQSEADSLSRLGSALDQLWGSGSEAGQYAVLACRISHSNLLDSPTVVPNWADKWRDEEHLGGVRFAVQYGKGNRIPLHQSHRYHPKGLLVLDLGRLPTVRILAPPVLPSKEGTVAIASRGATFSVRVSDLGRGGLEFIEPPERRATLLGRFAQGGDLGRNRALYVALEIGFAFQIQACDKLDDERPCGVFIECVE